MNRALGIALLLALLVAACGDDDDADASTSACTRHTCDAGRMSAAGLDAAIPSDAGSAPTEFTSCLYTDPQIGKTCYEESFQAAIPVSSLERGCIGNPNATFSVKDQCPTAVPGCKCTATGPDGVTIANFRYDDGREQAVETLSKFAADCTYRKTVAECFGGFEPTPAGTEADGG